MKAAILPNVRYRRSIRTNQDRGLSGPAALEVAWALPGVSAAIEAEDDSFDAVSALAVEIQARPVRCLEDLALVAKATTVLIWPNGRFEAGAWLGEDEDLDKSAARVLINACVGLAEASACPGSDGAVSQAIDDHKRANHEFDDAVIAADPIAIRRAGGDTSEAALAPLEAAERAASAAEEKAWRDLFETRPTTLFGFLRLLRHTAKHYDSNRGMDDEPDVFGALIGAVEGLRFALHPRPAEHDLSLLSVAELEGLARIAGREREAILAAQSTPICWDELTRNYTELGKLLDAEYERMGFLGDHAIQEIERRRPTDQTDTNLRLEALVRHHLNCNGYIESELMTEVVQAWGRA